MAKWIKTAQHEDLDKKYEEYLRLQKIFELDIMNNAKGRAAQSVKSEIEEESLRKANSVLSGQKNINGMKVNFIDLPAKKGSRSPLSHSKIITNSGRATVLADINGVRIPFYVSSGQGGKENVVTGKWYAFFGEHEEGWMNKGQQDQINNSYGSEKIAAIENWLNTNLNFLKNFNIEGTEFSPLLPTSVMTKTKDHLPLINRDLKPARNQEHDNWNFVLANEWGKLTPEQQQTITRKNYDDLNENVRQLIEKLDRATESSYLSSSSKIMNLVLSGKVDENEIQNWSMGYCSIKNPPQEIRNYLVKDLKAKVYSDLYLFKFPEATNFFRNYIPYRTLSDLAFEYILDHNEEYLKLYKDYGRPTQKQNLEIMNILETEGYVPGDLEESKNPNLLASPLQIRGVADTEKKNPNFFGDKQGKSGTFGGTGGKRR